MAENQRSEAEANAINEEMVRQMEERRKQFPERRRRAATNDSRKPPERRAICSFCFQPGDHRTAAQCLRALGG